MSSDFSHRLIMLKPMQTAASGYARIQSDRGQTQLQINARGLRVAAMRAFWYAGGGEVCELGSARVNPHGEATVTVELPGSFMGPERLQALLLVGDEDEPTPLMIGLCVQQSAGSLLDAKNALLALCERLSRNARARREQEEAREPGAQADPPQGPQSPLKALLQPVTQIIKPAQAPASQMPDQKPALANLPREIFLPAIDPSPYTVAKEIDASGELNETNEIDASNNVGKTDEQTKPNQVNRASENSAPSPIHASPPNPSHLAAPLNPAQRPAPLRHDMPPCDRLRPLSWPKAFEQLKIYFDRCMPHALFALPGWRFVHIATGPSATAASDENGLWVGYAQQDGSVNRIAYALCASHPPKDGRPYHPRQGLDGKMYQVLWQRV